MSDEPLFCVVCGEEYCNHSYDSVGPYCDVCGVIPKSGMECSFYRKGGRKQGCVPLMRKEEFK